MPSLRTIATLLAAAGLALCGAGAASGAALGTVTVAYVPGSMSYTITPQSLTGGPGDTFTVANTMSSLNAWLSLVNATGQATAGGTACATDASCRVVDAAGSASGSFTVVSPGTFTFRRTLDGGSSYATLGTLTISEPAPAPSGPVITVTGVNPGSGLTTGEEVITITGSGFSGGAAPTVSLGGTAATGVSVVNDTTVTAITPARAAGTVDVSVARDGGIGTAAGAYEYKPGHWLTITTRQPPGTGGTSDRSTGAVRTEAFGRWQRETAQSRGLIYSVASYEDYTGGINCGNRVQRKALVGGFRFLGSETVWDGGPCRYAFPAGTAVALSALPSSSTSAVPLFDDYWAGLFNRWTGACTGTTSECSVTMSADRAVTAAWGRFAWGIVSGTAVATPVFADDGSLSYAVLTVRFAPTASAADGSQQYLMVASFTQGASAASRSSSVRRVAACRGAARFIGRRPTAARTTGRGRLAARCRPTKALAAALRKGPVRVTTRWYLRAPRQKAAYPLGQARAHLSNRRAGAVTG